jgi:CRP-like cAMP-binding protein/zinc transporter ZupT
MDFSWLHFNWALGFGSLSAVSLVLGSTLGLFWRPSVRIISIFTAFGAGALLAALTVELVAPTALAVTEATHGGGHGGRGGSGPGDLIAMLFGAIAGGMLFVTLDQLISAKGGFLRKTATTIAFLSKARTKRTQEILHRLSEVEILRQIPAEEVQHLVEVVRPVSFNEGEVLFEEGSDGDGLYFIESGVFAVESAGAEINTLKAGSIVGEISLLTGAKRTASVKANTNGKALFLMKSDFDELRKRSPALEAVAADLASNRLKELADHHKAKGDGQADWASRASEALVGENTMPTVSELREASEQHSGAPLAIWLGLLLDGIPESFVIGASLLTTLAHQREIGNTNIGFFDVLPYTLIAGLFLSNFPEAMSSSVGMHKQGWSRKRIFLMWLGLMIVTAAGSGIGYWLGDHVSGTILLSIEGLAAGAMLTMIASTMLPEAVHLGGPTITGLGTLSGFVAAISFKLLE